MDIPKQVEHFNALSNDTKKLKVLEMLRQLQSTHKTFEMFYKTINSIQEIDDKMLVYIYQSILEIAEDLSLGNKEAAENKIKRFSEIIAEIKRQEELDKKQEGDPEDLLKNI